MVETAKYMKVNLKTFFLDTLTAFVSLIGVKLVFHGLQYLKEDVFEAAIAAIFFGLAYRRLMNIWFKHLRKKLEAQIVIELNADENLIHEGDAGHLKGLESVGGKLALTDRRLIFKSHRMNIQVHEESFLLHDIVDVTVKKVNSETTGIITVKFSNASMENFTVYYPEQWMEIIQQTVKSV